uniref:Carbohydrate kinase PfkB domain-containing protein n=1 Tax=Fagus sylvatica TaxID=28930 RepID=A0A2N9ICB1_FAGSY
MVAEPFLHNNNNDAPLVLGLQPAALIDHVARVGWSFLEQVPGDRGGSTPVAIEELEHILSKVETHNLGSPNDPLLMKTMAGGSVANTVRGLSVGFGVSSGIIGAYGDNEQGQLFVNNMTSNGVNLSRLRIKDGPTGQCVCLVDELGNRTMRPCLSNAVKVQADDLTREDFKGSKWLLLRYGIFNVEVIQAAIKIAKQEGLSVSLDLASFELLKSGDIDLCFANEDEGNRAAKVGGINFSNFCRGEQNADPEGALEFLAKHCRWAVVTLGPNGCIAKHGKEIVRVPAIGESKAIDATGAGDLFASGFLYGLVKGFSLEECCKVGSCSGGSVIRSLGGEVTPENWQWMYKQMQIKGLPVPDIHK